MLPVPPWRFAPFRAPAAFDVNQCTNSVLPGSIAPRSGLRRVWVLWPLLSGIPWKLQLLEYQMGPFPTLAPQRNSSILTDLNALLAGFALPSRASYRVCGLEIPPPKAPAITAEDPFPPPYFRRISWDFAIKIVFREPRL
jgi:hypothetical protein